MMQKTSWVERLFLKGTPQPSLEFSKINEPDLWPSKVEPVCMTRYRRGADYPLIRYKFYFHGIKL